MVAGVLSGQINFTPFITSSNKITEIKHIKLQSSGLVLPQEYKPKPAILGIHIYGKTQVYGAAG